MTEYRLLVRTRFYPTLPNRFPGWQREFARYACASAIALAVDVLTLDGLTEFLGLSYLVSGAVAFMLGLVTVYGLSVAWVFDRRRMSGASEFLVFLTVGIFGLGLNEMVLFVLTAGAGLHYLWSKAASIAVVFCWNFFARKQLLFR